ncbi:hypothetical protein G6F35_015661 [Rhizopus arrhizus]|nr:hypothetical protein G6F35_015661 [Rhizopus arrhizus]
MPWAWPRRAFQDAVLSDGGGRRRAAGLCRRHRSRHHPLHAGRRAERGLPVGGGGAVQLPRLVLAAAPLPGVAAVDPVFHDTAVRRELRRADPERAAGRRLCHWRGAGAVGHHAGQRRGSDQEPVAEAGVSRRRHPRALPKFSTISAAPASTKAKPSQSAAPGRSPTSAIAPSTPTTGTISVVNAATVALTFSLSTNQSQYATAVPRMM